LEFHWPFRKRQTKRPDQGVRREERRPVVPPPPPPRPEPVPLRPQPDPPRPSPQPDPRPPTPIDETIAIPVTPTRITGILAVIDGSPPEKLFAIHEGENPIGREERARVRISLPTVSRKHAMILCTNGSFSIQALANDRRNPTFLNDQPIDREILSDGDVIRVSTVSLKFRVM